MAIQQEQNPPPRQLPSLLIALDSIEGDGRGVEIAGAVDLPGAPLSLKIGQEAVQVNRKALIRAINAYDN